jgi:PAS domain S-box-containing protein
MHSRRISKFRETSVASTVVIVMVLLTALPLFGLGLAINRIAHDRWWSKLTSDQTILADQLVESLSLPLWNFDNAQIGKILESVMKNENVFAIVVTTTGKQPRTYARTRNAKWEIVDTDREIPTEGLLVEKRDIRFLDTPIGKVELVTTPKFVETLLSRTRTLIVILLLPLELILALGLYLLLWRMVLRPLKEVKAYAVSVSSGDEQGVIVRQAPFYGELESVWSSIEKMVAMLRARYAEVHAEVNRRTESELRYRTLFESAGDAIFLMEGDRFIDCNAKTLEMFACTREQILGSPPYRFSPQCQADHSDSQEKALEKITAAMKGVPQFFEWKHTTFDGRPFDAEVSLNRIELKSGVYLQAIVRDITERKRAEAELKKSEERFIQLFMLAPVGMTVSSLTDGRLLDVNQEFERMLGFSRKDALGKTSAELGVWLNQKEREDIVRVMRTEGKIKDRELQVRAKQGNIVTQRFNADAIEIDGSPCLLAAFLDVTRQKEAEKELKKYQTHLEELVEERTAELSAANKKLKELDTLKSMFIASMSHELRTPLNSIIGFTGMTLQGMSGELNDEQKDNLTRAYFSAKHLLDLITDVIDISKIEAGRIDVYPEKFLLREVVDDAIATVEPQLKDKGLTLTVDVPPGMNLKTDRKRLLQCVINFLSNAVKYTEQGIITIAARETDGQVALSVTDTGIGIAEKDISRLFEPFERLDTHLRVKAGGTGLGLYLTKKLAANILHGGISVTSVEGQGSTFSISFPMDIGESESNFEDDTL